MRARRLSRALLSILCALALLLAVPAHAYADDDYTLDATSIWATVGTTGTVDVVEERVVDLDGHFHGFFWQIDTGVSELGDVGVEVLDAGEVDGQGNLMPYEFASSGDAEGTWTLKEHKSYVRVDVHYDKYDERPVFYVHYTIDGVAARWADTGELYWKFVGDRWDRTSADVECHVFFEGAPAGTQVTGGDNLRGWLHNASLEGTIDVPAGTIPAWDDLQAGDPGTLDMVIPHVYEGDFAEIRSAFPAEWLSGAKDRGRDRLQTILSEEAGWAEEANANRERAGLFATIKKWVYTILGALSVVVALLSRLSYSRSHKATFDDKYFRDVPSGDHPAVLHRIYEGSCGDGPDFTASLMRLSDLGVITLDKTTSLRKRLGRKPKEEEDWLLTRVPSREAALTDPIDQATMEFVFDYVGERAAQIDDLNVREPGTTRMSDFKRVAKRDEDTYVMHLDLWKGVVEAQFDERGLDNDTKKDMTGPLFVMLAVDFFVLAFAIVDIIFFSAHSLRLSGQTMGVGLRAGVLGAGFAALIVSMATQTARSDEAIEIKAKMDALKRWLKDFTRLKEAVPTDVVLWDRLLVMAVVMGVSDKVIEELRIAAPEVVEDATFARTMMWCDPGMSAHSPAETFSSDFSSAAASASGDSGGASGCGGGGGGGGGGGAY